MTTNEAILTILILAAVTLATRALPFLLFPAGKKPPASIHYLGSVLPSAVIGMLVVYCFQSVQPLAWPYGLPEGISLVILVIVHTRWHNMLLSIGGSTLLYMFLVQTIFA